MRRALSASAAAAFFASFSAFLALPDSFFAFPPLGGILVTEHGASDGESYVDEDGSAGWVRNARNRRFGYMIE